MLQLLRRNKPKISALIVFFICAITRSGSTEIIKLSSGRAIDGKITKVSISGITLSSKGKEESITYSFIKNISSSENEELNSEYLPQIGFHFSPEEYHPSRIQFYMAEWCPYCRKMEQFLISENIPFDKLDIEVNPLAKMSFQRYAINGGIPVLYIGGKVVNGYDPKAVKRIWLEWQENQ